MINLSAYYLQPKDRVAIERLLFPFGFNPNLSQIWGIMDEVWQQCGCDQQCMDPESYRRFYTHPVWLLNGIYIEQDPVSMGHRRSIARAVASVGAKHILDFGGGFGTLARLIAVDLPASEIAIYDPFPPAHGLQACRTHPNIRFIDSLESNEYDALVCTDVLEHVHDPLCLLADMVKAVKPSGHLFIANCFAPVIQCHLPCTFHLRYFFSWCAAPLGLERLGHCQGSHAWIYRRRADGAVNLREARFREQMAKLFHPLLACLAPPLRVMLRSARSLRKLSTSP